MFAVVAVPILAVAVIRGSGEIAILSQLFPWWFFLADAPQSREIDMARPDAVLVLLHWLLVGFASLAAFGFVFEGLRQHVKFGSLERRLAALRPPAP